MAADPLPDFRMAQLRPSKHPEKRYQLSVGTWAPYRKNEVQMEVGGWWWH